MIRWQTAISYPGKTTNNQAEYMTLIAGLRSILFDCRALGIDPLETTLEVFSDSQLVVNQVNGRWKMKNAELRKLQAEATKLLGQCRSWELSWHPRSESVRILGH